MDDIKINGRAIYTTKGAAREYGRVGSGMWLDGLTKKITDAGKTVYLKESCRTLLRRCYKDEYHFLTL